MRRVLALLVARPVIAIVIAAAVVGVLLLVQTHEETTPVTHRTEHVALSDEQQTQLGDQQYAKTLRQDRAKIVSSGAEYAQVQRVARRIEVVAGRDKPAFNWKVTLLRKNEANAYCLPGGKIVVYTGILPVTGNDAALATVLGHEVAHATAEHAAERIEREHLTRVAAAIIAGGVAFTPGQYVRVEEGLDIEAVENGVLPPEVARDLAPHGPSSRSIRASSQAACSASGSHSLIRSMRCSSLG